MLVAVIESIFLVRELELSYIKWIVQRPCPRYAFLPFLGLEHRPLPWVVVLPVLNLLLCFSVDH